MSYRFDPAARLPDEIRRVVEERLDDAIDRLDGLASGDPADVASTVHQVRKRCKEVRGAARLVRPALGGEFDEFNHRVRDAAAELSSIRDDHALLATFENLQRASGTDDGLERIHRRQADTADEATRSITGADPRIERARRLLAKARKRARRWKLDDDVAVIGDGLRRTYHRGRVALRDTERYVDDDAVHEWRKAVKNLWYQVRLLEDTAPSVLRPLAATLDGLGEALGDDHDLAVLIDRLGANGDDRADDTQHAIELARAQQAELRSRALRLGATVYAEKAPAFVDRLTAYWMIAHALGPELPAGGIAAIATAIVAPPTPSTPVAPTPEPEEVPVTTTEQPVTTAVNGSHPAPAEPDEQPPVVERERTFLVDRLPALDDTGVELRQGYLAIEGTVSVRIRDAAGACTLTVKAGSGATRTQIELPMAAEQFEASWDLTRGRRVHKRRHRLPLEGHTVDLDVFSGDLDGLVLAEVEFGSDDEMASFTPPDWFGREVTDDDRYANASLAVLGIDPSLFR